MLKRLRILHIGLAVLSVGFAGYIGRQLTAPVPTPARPPARPAEPSEAAPSPVQAPVGATGVIAARNLFSPNRTETATRDQAGPVVPQFTKPNLYGVVLRDGAPVAYLEDPVTKRVAGYHVGDFVAGATIQTISADRVVLTRPEGRVDVQLHDPSKPRPALPPGAPGAGPIPDGTPPQLVPVPGAGAEAIQPPATGVQPQPGFPPRRPLPLPRRFQRPAQDPNVPGVPQVPNLPRAPSDETPPR